MIHFLLTLPYILQVYKDQYLIPRKREMKVGGSRLRIIEAAWKDKDHLTLQDIDLLLNTKSQPATRNRYRSLLRHLFNWAEERQMLMFEQGASLKWFKLEPEHNERDRRVSAEEEARLLGVMDVDLKNLFMGAIDTGLRYGTLTKLKCQNVKDGDKIAVPKNIQKHREGQIIPLTKRLRAYVRIRCEHWGEAPLFPISGFRAQWKKAKKDAKVRGLHWHDIRGEFASRLGEKNVEVNVISKLLGHHSLAMTQRYLRPRVEQFKDAIERLDV